MYRSIIFLTVFGFCNSAFGESESTWNSEINIEWRYFDDIGEFGQERRAFSVSAKTEYFTDWNNGNDTFILTPFVRVDEIDDNRSHYDLREGYWGHVGNNWETKVGVTRVFWGRTEFLNLVDIVNQKDLVEGDTKEKLGQPLIGLSLDHGYSIIDFYALLGFRERTFPGEEGRLRTPIVVDSDNARYEGVSQDDINFAARWSLVVTDELEVAFSMFSGTNREPRFDFNYDLFEPMLIPVYSHIDQYGIELEYIYESWVGKLEYVEVDGDSESYTAAIIGGEYIFSGVFNTNLDVTFISEYLWDERGGDSLGFLERDLAIGARFTFNDVQSTSILIFGIIDFDSKETLYNFEASRRLGDNWRIELLATVVGERAKEQQGETLSEISAILFDNGVFPDNLDLSFALDIVRDIIDQKGISFLFNEFNTYDEFVNTIQQLQEISDSDMKLSILESDDYIQFEIKYFF